MSKENDGGPAFSAEHHPECNGEFSNGMSLRDYFAGQAMSGLTSTTDSEGTWVYGTPANVAEVSYKISDAMIKERDK